MIFKRIFSDLMVALWSLFYIGKAQFYLFERLEF